MTQLIQDMYDGVKAMIKREKELMPKPAAVASQKSLNETKPAAVASQKSINES